MKCVYPNGHSFFFLQRNADFYSCTQTAIRYFTVKYKILQLCSNGHSVFYSEMQNFETLPKQPFCFFTTKHKILKTARKRPFVFYNKIQNFESCTQTAIRISHKEIQNLTIYHQFFSSFISQKLEKNENMISRYLVSFFYNEKQT